MDLLEFVEAAKAEYPEDGLLAAALAEIQSAPPRHEAHQVIGKVLLKGRLDRLGPQYILDHLITQEGIEELYLYCETAARREALYSQWIALHSESRGGA